MKNYIVQLCTALLMIVQLTSCNDDIDPQNPIDENDAKVSLELANSTDYLLLQPSRRFGRL